MPGRVTRRQTSGRGAARARGMPQGLEGVVVGVSAICAIDGARGRLSYRGYDIADLVAQATFPEVVLLLWHGELPPRARLRRLEADLRRAGDLPDAALALLRRLPAQAPPLAVLRTMVSALAHLDPDARAPSPAAAQRNALRLVAQVPTIAAAFHRIRRGRGLPPRRDDLGHAARFLYMLHGAVPDPEAARALDAVWILYADHEFNASTFAARVTAATGADVHAAVTSALGALMGPLHGGAAEDVSRLLGRIGVPRRARAVVDGLLAAGRRIPGFGHRVYRGEDPRATLLRQIAGALAERAGEGRWYEITRAVEAAVRVRRTVHANVDLYAPALYAALGIPQDLYAAVFAGGRVAGWTAHILEQYGDNRLIRPLAEYIGPSPRAFVPLAARR